MDFAHKNSEFISSEMTEMFQKFDVFLLFCLVMFCLYFSGLMDLL